MIAVARRKYSITRRKSSQATERARLKTVLDRSTREPNESEQIVVARRSIPRQSRTHPRGRISRSLQPRVTFSPYREFFRVFAVALIDRGRGAAYTRSTTFFRRRHRRRMRIACIYTRGRKREKQEKRKKRVGTLHCDRKAERVRTSRRSVFCAGEIKAELRVNRARLTTTLTSTKRAVSTGLL